MNELDALRAARLEYKQAELSFLSIARELGKERRRNLVPAKVYEEFDSAYADLLLAAKRAETP